MFAAHTIITHAKIIVVKHKVRTRWKREKREKREREIDRLSLVGGRWPVHGKRRKVRSAASWTGRQSTHSESPHITATMGIFDYVSDLYSSLSVQSAEAEVQDDLKYASGDLNSGEDHQKLGTAEQTRGATTRGGVSLDSPAAGTDEESGAEAEANKQDARKPEASNEKGHVAGSGGEGSGQVGADNAGPHGGPVGKQTDDDDEEEEEEAEDEDDEEEDEPEDPKPKIEEGTSTRH
jgi:ubiquinol-cytochrome c reductase subunit 6